MFSLDSDGLVNSAPEFLVDDDYAYSIGGADYDYSSAKEVKHMGWGLLLFISCSSFRRILYNKCHLQVLTSSITLYSLLQLVLTGSNQAE